MVAGGTIEALARQLAGLAVVAALTGLLAAPALVAVGAHTRTCDGVALGAVLALAAVVAVGSPVVALAACRRTHRERERERETLASEGLLSP